MLNYYFKFQKGNAGFDRFFKSGDSLKEASALKRSNIDIPLSIYYGKWKSDEREKGISKIRKDKKLGNDGYNKGIVQIKEFYDLSTLHDDIYFWAFYNDIVICLKPNDLTVTDGPAEFIDQNGSLPKAILCKIHLVYKKIDLPEVFSNINSNQKYNRLTIAKLENAENEIASALLNNHKIKIDSNSILKYLSPTEFETLMFLVFSNTSVLCSSYRGSTLKDYDLRIKILQDYHGLPKGTHWVQIKMKDRITHRHGLIYVHSGKTDIEKQIIGIDWIADRIKDNAVIQKWLYEMIYNYEIFETAHN